MSPFYCKQFFFFVFHIYAGSFEKALSNRWLMLSELVCDIGTGFLCGLVAMVILVSVCEARLIMFLVLWLRSGGVREVDLHRSPKSAQAVFGIIDFPGRFVDFSRKSNGPTRILSGSAKSMSSPNFPYFLGSGLFLG